MIYKSEFFRKEALKHKAIPLAGRVILTSPFIFTVLTYISCLLVLFIIIFIMFTDYSRKTTIKGQVYPEDGITKVYSRETGIINKVMIKDGQFVKKGEVLGVIYKAQNLNTGILQDKLKEQAILKKKTLDQAIDKIDKIGGFD